MSKLTDQANGKMCQIRLPGCRWGGSTIVPCHIRLKGTGYGRKEDDLLVAWGCNNCHDIVDGRKKLRGMTKNEIKIAHHEGVFRTQLELRKSGHL